MRPTQGLTLGWNPSILCTLPLCLALLTTSNFPSFPGQGLATELKDFLGCRPRDMGDRSLGSLRWRSQGASPGGLCTS